MTACPNCGKEPCVTPGFCATCEKREAEDFAAQLNAKLEEQKKAQEARLKELARKGSHYLRPRSPAGSEGARGSNRDARPRG
jgi:hypothetical protein